MNEGSNQTMRQMREYLRLSTKLDGLEDAISEGLWRLRDNTGKTKQFSAVERKYWLRIITRTIISNNKLVLRVANHYWEGKTNVRKGSYYLQARQH